MAEVSDHMHIPPSFVLSTLPPLPTASVDGAAATDAASELFSDVLQSQEWPLVEQRAEWPQDHDFVYPFSAEGGVSDRPAQNALTGDDPLQIAGVSEGAFGLVTEGLVSENVSNAPENSIFSSNLAESPRADGQGAYDTSGAPSGSEAAAIGLSPDLGQSAAQRPPPPELLQSAMEPFALAPESLLDPSFETGPEPEPEPGPESAPEAGDLQASEPSTDAGNPAESPQPDGPQVQEVVPETVSDLAEIDLSDLAPSGDPMADAGPSQNGPSSSSSTGAAASSSSPILTQQGAPLADQMIQLAQTTPDGPVTLTLSPDDLGTLSFEMQQSSEGVSVHLTVERQETLDLLRRNTDQLLDAFRQAGFAGASFTFGGGDGGQRDRPPPQTATAWPDPIPPTVQRFAIGLLDMRL